MVFSASYAQGLVGYGDPYFFIYRQIIWTTIGVIGLIATSRINYSFWERYSIPLMGVTLLALMAVIVLGSERFGSTRTFFGGSVQPSEPAKIVIIIYVSTWLASKGRKIQDVKVGLIPFSILMGAMAVMIVTQPDISTAILIVITASIMFFIAGAKLNQLFVVALGTTATFAMVINYSSYAKDRVSRYWESIRNPLESTEWQAVQSVQALVDGGPFGVGLGNSVAKLPGRLPVSWSDNIFAIIGEEMGLLGTLFVILLFTLLAYRGLRIALQAPNNFGMLLATGITTLFILQAILNAAVVVAVAPATGVTLPFISYGGSSLVTALGAAGILLNISRYNDGTLPTGATTGKMSHARFNFGWGDRRTRLSGAGRRGTTRSGGRRPAVKSSGRRTAGGQRKAQSQRTSAKSGKARR